jgi:probable F420-dependent oxidoreductase
VRFSIWPNLQQPLDIVMEVAAHADTTGWGGVWVADHFMGNEGDAAAVATPTYEATAVLAGLATATTNVRIGPLVLGSTYRHPAVLSNWAASVDQLSGGRLVLGVGAGWQENEHAQYGIELPPLRDRVDRFDEYCQVLNALLRAERTTVAGRWFTMTDAVCEPKPVQQPLPLLIGGKGDRMMTRVARYADEWNMWSLPAQFAERSGVLDQRCEAIDRDPSEIHRSTQALVMLTDDDDRARQIVEACAPRVCVAGTAQHLAEVIGEWRDVGVDEVIVPDWILGRGAKRFDNMDEIIETVAPQFR